MPPIAAGIARRTALLIGDSNACGVNDLAKWLADTTAAPFVTADPLRWIWWEGPNSHRNVASGMEQYVGGTNSNWHSVHLNLGPEVGMLKRMTERYSSTGDHQTVVKVAVWQSAVRSTASALGWRKSDAQIYTVHLDPDWAQAYTDATATWPGRELYHMVCGVVLGAVDCLDATAATNFAADLQQLVVDIDADLQNGATTDPVYAICRIPSVYRDAADAATGSSQGTTVYNAASTAVSGINTALARTAAYLVDTDALTLHSDSTHFDVAGSLALGEAIINVVP